MCEAERSFWWSVSDSMQEYELRSVALHDGETVVTAESVADLLQRSRDSIAEARAALLDSAQAKNFFDTYGDEALGDASDEWRRYCVLRRKARDAAAGAAGAAAADDGGEAPA